MKLTAPEAPHVLQLHWVIDFTRAELKSVDDLTALKQKLYEFVVASNLQDPSNEAHRLSNLVGEEAWFTGLLTMPRLARIQEELTKGLDALADESAFSWTLTKQAPGNQTFRHDVRFSWRAFFPQNRFAQNIQLPNDPLDQSVLALGLHVAYSGLTGEQIRRCPECGKVFVRERKPQQGRTQYCSRECARAVANRNYLARLAEQKRLKSNRTKEKETHLKKTLGKS